MNLGSSDSLAAGPWGRPQTSFFRRKMGTVWVKCRASWEALAPIDAPRNLRPLPLKHELLPYPSLCPTIFAPHWRPRADLAQLGLLQPPSYTPFSCVTVVPWGRVCDQGHAEADGRRRRPRSPAAWVPSAPLPLFALRCRTPSRAGEPPPPSQLSPVCVLICQVMAPT